MADTMAKQTDSRIVDVEVDTEQIEYRTPIKFGGRVVNDAVLVNVSLTLETGAAQTGRGFGSMSMGNVWAWPSSALSPQQTLDAMIELSKRMAAHALTPIEPGHPIETTLALASGYGRLVHDVEQSLGLTEPIPKLAQLVAASPIEAAIYDAYGKALNRNIYHLLSKEFVSHDLGFWLGPAFQGEYLDRYTLAEPKARMPLYHLVGALDPLEDADVSSRVNDGLPETLPEWILADGLTHLKIKLNGDDLAWDVDRVVSVERVAAEAQRRRGCVRWHYSLDFNEKCRDVEYVLEFLSELRRLAPQALDRVQYIEQPTHRDLKAHRHQRMHQAAAIKPVVIDESLVDFESLLLSRELGYSGVALKACKGQTESLLMSAAAQKFGMFLCVQDLTCPGYSFLHSASLAARVPTIAAVEGNSRQYCPKGNAAWSDRYPSVFRVIDGTIDTSVLTAAGLGFG
jgi:L-alanine-DL-glutamate epimerase-like enolase superfamily enzyme